MRDVAGKVALILGGAGGIGRATAKVLARNGLTPVLADIDPQKMQSAVAEIREHGGIAHGREVDVRDRRDLQHLVADVLRDFGRLDVLINAAGIMFVRPIIELETDEWELTIDLNVKGAMWGVAAVLPTFLAQQSGHIITLGSIHGLKVSDGGAVHSASKFAVRAFGEGLRSELAQFGVRVTTIMPGAVATGMEYKTTGTDHERIRAIYAHAIPAEAVAQAIAFAVAQPPSVAINELVIRPTAQEI